MSNPYRDIKIKKLEEFLEWLGEQRSSKEVKKLTKRLEQQLAFLKYATDLG